MSDPPVTPYDVVELRVHGVSGADASAVLGRPFVQQVAGDRNGGFHRPRPGYPDSRGAGGVTMEAYRWSDLPSGTAVRTLSLVFLLPFMLCNVAIWMRPRSRGSGAGVKALCRMLALTLTALYVLSIVGVALDLVAWRCMSSPRCLAGRDWLSWLGGRPTGLRLAVLALVPAAAIGLVWRLGARPGRNFDAFRGPAVVSGAHQLSAVGQWDAAPLVGRLRSIHVAAAFATLDLSLLVARSARDASVVVLALTAATGVVLLACLVLVCAHPVIDGTAPAGVDQATGALQAAACALTALVLVVVAADPAPWPSGGGLPGYGLMVAGLFAVQTVLLAALGLVALRGPDGQRGGTPLRGLGGPVIAAVATGLAVAFSAELVYRVADMLDRDAPTAQRLATSPPLAYKWAIFGFMLAVLATLAVAAVATVLTRPGRLRAAASTVARDFPDAPPEADGRLRQVEKAVARARFTEWLEPLTVVYACLAALGLAASSLGMLRLNPGDAAERYAGVPAALVDFGIGVGSYLIAAVVLALVVGGIFAYRTAEFRRYVGVLWDLGTFWPRAAHPFAPPCYAERAVPELTRRICYLTGRGDTVLLAGHSHGSVLLAATVLQLPPGVGERVALLTYGSPLRRLYTRLFPAYVDADVLREVGERVGWRWLNLWRDTDSIGSWIFSPHRPGEPPAVAGAAGAVDRRLRDPWDVVAPPSDSVPPPILGHWPGESDVRFAAAVEELADRLRRQAPPPA
ncbi:hypothetical protein DER29_4173 [Micromonospora sp. M71_S20]|uniref:hypothetical protein n=1 Tax=Micromonospora sp. M71_S20 TaxID=592872 RepID=UPI000EAFB9D7|nr:hypothetical protein [Micromonospora sp. M71_S20]RLK26153.1 hypothetical protein DER29_4173 [Micromonospora sp. M71_S20]